MNKNRIIAVQGPTQLINVIAVLSYRRDHEGQEGFSDHLVLGGMSGGAQVHRDLCKVCHEIARAWPFASFLGFDEYENPPGDANAFDEAVGQFRTSIGVSDSSEIYVARNWQLFNELALHAYPKATRICYGDGFGTLDLNGGFRSSGTYSPHGFMAIDAAYLFFPVAEDPERKSLQLVPRLVTPDHEFLTTTIRRIAGCIPELIPVCSTSALPSCKPLALVLTSTFTEASYFKTHPMADIWRRFTGKIVRMLTKDFRRALLHSNCREEMSLYLSQIRNHDLSEMTVLVKGHPRQRLDQSSLLAKTLRDQGIDAIELPGLQHYPIELVACHLPFRLVVAFGSSSSATLSLLCPDCTIDPLVREDLRKQHFRPKLAEQAGSEFNYYLLSMSETTGQKQQCSACTAPDICEGEIDK